MRRPPAFFLSCYRPFRLLFFLSLLSLSLLSVVSFTLLPSTVRQRLAEGLKERLAASSPRWLQRLQTHSARLRAPTFVTIAAKNSWNAPSVRAARSVTATLAGPGSTLNYTAAARAFLSRAISARGVRSVADLSCSELHWQIELDGFCRLESFAGYDIVPAVVATARARGAAAAAACAEAGGPPPPALTFAVADSVSDPPFPAVDLVILRDTLMHLPLHDALAVLARIDASGSRYLATTTFKSAPGVNGNAYISPGGWFPVDLSQPPFLLPEPEDAVLEGFPGVDRYGDKRLAIWRLPVLAALPSMTPAPAGSADAGDGAGRAAAR